MIPKDLRDCLASVMLVFWLCVFTINCKYSISHLIDVHLYKFFTCLDIHKNMFKTHTEIQWSHIQDYKDIKSKTNGLWTLFNTKIKIQGSYTLIVADFKGLPPGLGNSQGVDNPYKVVVTRFAIGYSGVSGAQWLGALE